MKWFILFFISAVSLISCTDDYEVSSYPEVVSEVEDVVVRLVISTPSTILPKTITTRASDESSIRQIQVFVFQNGEYKYRSAGLSIQSSGTTTSFNALLTSSSSPLKLYIVANATDAVLANEPQAGDNEALVKAKILQTYAQSGIGDVIPMFGECDVPGLLPGQVNQVSNIKMLRAIARVDVKAQDVVSNFELKSVQVFRVNDKVQVIPGNSATPSIPSTSQTINTISYPVTGNELVSGIYIPESASPVENERISKATCVVVGGIFNNSGKITYYRVDFNSVTSEQPFGQVCRNYRYVLNIKKVSAAGWNNAEDAANNAATNLEVQIKEWDDNSSDIYFDGVNYFALSSRTVVLPSIINYVKSVDIDTDVDEYTMQWADEEGNGYGGSAGWGEYLENDTFKVSLGSDGKSLQVTTLRLNTGISNYSKKILITAKRLRIVVTIMQTPASDRPAVTVLSYRGHRGALGSNFSTPHAYATGLKPILVNSNNFGTAGTFPFDGFTLVESYTSPGDGMTIASLAGINILFLPNWTNDNLTLKSANVVKQWLEAKKNRIMIFSFEDGRNKFMLEALGVTVQNPGYSGNYKLAPKPGNSPVTDNGLFGELPQNMTYNYVDGIFSTVNHTLYTDITPVLLADNGECVLGVDYKNRIVYCGEIQLFGYYAKTNALNNTTGEISTDAARLMANLWAWMAETALSEP